MDSRGQDAGVVIAEDRPLSSALVGLSPGELIIQLPGLFLGVYRHPWALGIGMLQSARCLARWYCCLYLAGRYYLAAEKFVSQGRWRYYNLIAYFTEYQIYGGIFQPRLSPCGVGTWGALRQKRITTLLTWALVLSWLLRAVVML